MTNAPGRMFLLVVGILYIVFAGIGLIGAIPMLLSASYWDAILPATLPWAVWYGFAALVGLYELFMGIMGVKNRNDLSKASFLRTLGFVSIALVVLSAIIGFTMFSGVFGGGVAIFTLIFGLILPVLYVIGAMKNMQASS